MVFHIYHIRNVCNSFFLLYSHVLKLVGSIRLIWNNMDRDLIHLTLQRILF